MDNRYKSNRAGRCMLLAFVGLIGVGLFLALNIVPLLRFFRHNELVNAPILAVFAAGVLLVYLNLARLSREERLANLVQRRCFVEARDGWGPEQLADRLAAGAVRTRVCQAQELGRRGGPAHEEALAEIGSAEEGARAATVRYLVGILVFLGLIGTFAGLLLTVDGVRGILAGMDLDPYGDMELYLRDVRRDLGTPLQGMATAFSTSLFGLGASVVLGFLALQMTRAQEYFLAKMNDLTVIYLFPAFHVGDRPAAAAAAAGPARAAAPEDARAREAEARYLEAGARALQKDVTDLTEVLQRSGSSQQEMVAAVRELAASFRRGSEALERLEALEQTRQQEQGALRELAERAREVSVHLQSAAEGEETRSRELKAQMERDTRTLANHLSGEFGDMSNLWDAAAGEICVRITRGLESVEKAIARLESSRGNAADGGTGRTPSGGPAPEGGSTPGAPQ